MGLLEDRAGLLWFRASGPIRGTYRQGGDTFQFLSTRLGDGDVMSIREDKSGNVWLGTTAGVYRIDG